MLIPAAVSSATSPKEFRQALPGYRYSFPRDHFAHPEFRTEWWYYTGNVRTQMGRRFGFELVFFRQAQQNIPASPSAWRAGQMFLAHTALTDAEAGRFFYRKRLNRAGPGIAGGDFEKRRVWNGNWSAQWKDDAQVLSAITDDFRLNLQLTPAKPYVIHGQNGVSQKAGGAGKASHYVSFPRLAVQGEIHTTERHVVSGTAWMDHEWFTHQLEPDQRGWDWFSIQLEDNRELMLFQLRRNDGTIDPFSAGTYVDSSGRARHLARRDFSLRPLRVWRSPKTKGEYPVEWQIAIPSLKLDLTCRAVLDSQELVTGRDAGPSYWEGAVDFSGTAQGSGYLEMTGYDKTVAI
jgi:predicted secreted hydrolase